MHSSVSFFILKAKSESIVRDDCSSSSSAGFSEINGKTSNSHSMNDLSYECLRKMSEWRKETEEEKQGKISHLLVCVQANVGRSSKRAGPTIYSILTLS